MDNCYTSILCDSEEYLKSIADKQYLKKYFEVKLCCPEETDRELKHSYLMLKYIDINNPMILELIEKQMTGGPEEKGKKRLSKIGITKTEWKCDNIVLRPCCE